MNVRRKAAILLSTTHPVLQCYGHYSFFNTSNILLYNIQLFMFIEKEIFVDIEENSDAKKNVIYSTTGFFL